MKRSIYLTLAVAVLFAGSAVGQITFIAEDFATGSGFIPPQGPPAWTSTLVLGNNPNVDGWRWDNPGGIALVAPLAAPASICNSDFSGGANQIQAQLRSPDFDASLSPRGSLVPLVLELVLDDVPPEGPLRESPPPLLRGPMKFTVLALISVVYRLFPSLSSHSRV